MEMKVTLNRGLDLRLKGEVPAGAPTESVAAARVAVSPVDYPGFQPKLDVKEGDPVKAGDPLMHDKVYEQICLVSPVTGKVAEVVRGERRKILRVVVEASAGAGENVGVAVPESSEAIIEAMQKSGVWALMRQRPYDIVPVPGKTPVNIFVTAFDSAPLAPDLTAMVAGKQAEVEAGLKALCSLTSGKVYVSKRADASLGVPAPAVAVEVAGAHPAGNAGVQAANIAPVNKGETIWTLDITTVARLGELLLHGAPCWDTAVAVTGPDVKVPRLVKTAVGASLKDVLDGDVADNGHHHRIIAGNVLTGVHERADGFLRYPYHQVTVIAEGDDVDEFMGWASLSPKKMSTSRSFLGWLMPRRKYAPDARLQGGRRAMIMSEVYDKVFPMDIMPEYLIKAIMSGDIDRMEQLGVYEVAPEDFALCEYVDPSKLELQKTVREGLDKLRKELE